MQNEAYETSEEYGLIIPREVSEKIRKATYKLISEDEVKDLQYVDISDNTYCVVKRIMDVCLSAVGLAILLIPVVAIAAIIFADDHEKVFFSQYRIGSHGKKFILYKFRTMKIDAPEYLPTMDIINPDQYITRAGHRLRKLSLDEIPQLLNVLKGDMSLVGPRPLISEENDIHQMRSKFGVYNLRPGITGLAQINGRDTVSPVDKVRWDVDYLKNFGLIMDVKILLATIPKIFRAVDVVEGYCIKEHDVGQ